MDEEGLWPFLPGCVTPAVRRHTFQKEGDKLARSVSVTNPGTKGLAAWPQAQSLLRSVHTHFRVPGCHTSWCGPDGSLRVPAWPGSFRGHPLVPICPPPLPWDQPPGAHPQVDRGRAWPLRTQQALPVGATRLALKMGSAGNARETRARPRPCGRPNPAQASSRYWPLASETRLDLIPC